ncbi:hypothetical protein BJX65DRAFT_309285 [Aspergillus insuetus]
MNRQLRMSGDLLENTPHEDLPETSYYHSASPIIAEIASGDKFASIAMPASTYAKGAVNDVLRGHSGMTWRGKISSTGRFVHSFFPTWLADLAFGSGSGLKKI